MFVKQIAILAVMVTFVINPVFACCHASATPSEQAAVASESDSPSSEKGCHDAAPWPSEKMAPMDCAGCAECDAYYQKANEVALKAFAAELPSAEKILAFDAALQIDVGLWISARLRPPSLAPPVPLSPVQLNNILIL